MARWVFLVLLGPRATRQSPEVTGSGLRTLPSGGQADAGLGAEIGILDRACFSSSPSGPHLE